MDLYPSFLARYDGGAVFGFAPRPLLPLVIMGIGSTAGLWVGVACDWGLTGGLPLVAALCDPSSTSPDNCPDTHFCCSDDPAARDGGKPDYMDKSISGGTEPYFSGINNARGTSGMCVRTDDIAGQGLTESAAVHCPIPCNPTWPENWIDDVCGTARVCCQTVELDPDDCVRDPVDGTFRPANGDDAVDSLAGGDRWKPTSTSTHQDPDFTTCETLAGARSGEVFLDCVRQLSTARERGFCMALGPGQECPVDDPDYVDACEAMN